MGEVSKHFVVTGGNGYIGSHMCRLLCDLGHKVSIIDDFTTSPAKATHAFGKFYQGDIGDLAIWEKIQQKAKVDGVFHFAANALVGESQSNPLKYYHNNLVKSLKLLEILKNMPQAKLIFSSTCATFGHPVSDTIDENHPQNPVNTYGKTKLMVEWAIKDLAEKKKISAVVLRYFNAAGCSPDGVIGENHDPETHLIPNIILSYLSGFKKPLQIFGKNYPTPDGTCIRDYIHVLDLVDAHWKAFEHLEQKKADYEHFNLGTGSGTSNLEMVTKFSKLIKENVPYEFAPARSGDPAKLVSSSQKAHQILGFKTRFNIDDCLKDSLNYFKYFRSKVLVGES